MVSQIRRALPLFALFAVLGAPVQADVLKLDDAVTMAVEHNLSLQRNAGSLEAKKRQADNAWGVLVPSTSLAAGLSKANQAVSNKGAWESNDIWGYSNSLGFSLTLSASILSNLESVKLNYEAGQLTYALAKRSLEKSVRLAYTSLLLEEQNLKLSRDTLARREKSWADTQTKYKVGLASDLDVLSAQVSAETLKPSLQRLEASHLNNIGQFQSLLGLPLGAPLTLEGDLDTAVEKLLNLDAASPGTSPDVKQAQLSITAGELNLDAQQLASWFPSLTLGWSTAPALTLKEDAKWADTSGSLSLRLSYSLDSFFPWTQGREKIVQAEESVRTSRIQLEETKTASELKRQNAYRLIRQSVQSLATQVLNVQLAQKTYDLSQDAYKRGTKDLLALQNSEGDLNQSRYELLSQRYTLISTVLDLEYELDVPFGTLLGGKK